MSRIDRFPVTRVVLVDPVTGNSTGGILPASASLDGTINTNGGIVGPFDASHFQSVSVQISGTFVGGIAFEVSNDGTNWANKTLNSSNGGTAGSTTVTVIASGDVGAKWFRVRATAWTSGTATVDLEFSAFSQSAIISPGQGTQTVTGTVNATMQPVSGTGSFSTTNLAANATYTGTTVDRGTSTGSTDTRIKPMVRHLAGLVHGHMILQESLDGTTWLETRRSPVPSDGNWHTFDWALHLRFWRLLFTNGATAQTGFGLMYQSSRGDGSSIDTRNVLNFPETAVGGAAIAASASLIGTTLDLGANHDWSLVRVSSAMSQTGATLRVEQSFDGSNWFLDSSASPAYSAASTLLVAESKIGARYVRTRIVNGATAQTDARLFTTLVSL